MAIALVRSVSFSVCGVCKQRSNVRGPVSLYDGKLERSKGNGGVTEHLSLWDPSNNKLAHGYKLQTVHKQQLVY